MYYYLTRAVKRRIILELQDSFSKHPVYKTLVPFIQDKFAYEDRPQYGIIVKNASASRQQLSADNFVCTVVSHVQKADVAGYPGTSVEWVREDSNAIRANLGVFPSDPGYYLITMLNTDNFGSQFNVTPYKSVHHEFLKEYAPTDTSVNDTLIVEAGLIQEGSLFVYTDTDAYLVKDTHYTVSYDTGEITLLTEMNNFTRIYVDYHYPVESTGPYTVKINTYNNTAIPGVILAFGRRMEDGDKIAVILKNKREITALEYGGKWEISISFDIMARDSIHLEEIADFTLMSLWAEKKYRLDAEGLVLTDMSHGGESEDIYDETGQDQYYMVSMDIRLSTDWSLFMPVPFEVLSFSFVSDLQAYRVATPEEQALYTSTLQIVPSLTPYMSKNGLSHNYERIT